MSSSRESQEHHNRFIQNTPIWVLHLFENRSERQRDTFNRLQDLCGCAKLQVLVPASVSEQYILKVTWLYV